MTSKEALEHIIFEAKLDKPIFSVYYQELIEAKEKIEKDLDRLEKLEKENQELKEQVNHFKKVFEDIKNLPNLDCTHMFDNCKKLTPLPESPELEKIHKKLRS